MLICDISGLATDCFRAVLIENEHHLFQKFRFQANVIIDHRDEITGRHIDSDISLNCGPPGVSDVLDIERQCLEIHDEGFRPGVARARTVNDDPFQGQDRLTAEIVNETSDLLGPSECRCNNRDISHFL